MFRQFILLEWKSFFRSASFATNLALKIIMGFMAVYFMVIFVAAGVGMFFLLKEDGHVEPLAAVNKFLIYYFMADLVVRYFFQKMPVTNIKPLLTLPINRNAIVHYTLGKSIISFLMYCMRFSLYRLQSFCWCRGMALRRCCGYWGFGLWYMSTILSMF